MVNVMNLGSGPAANGAEVIELAKDSFAEFGRYTGAR
jgi:hypothetical protein